ncbi:MAG: transposase [Actinobacteria bacterium]|nr:transposase [Actinomycetota bacterium]
MARGRYLERNPTPNGVFHVTAHSVPLTRLFGAPCDMSEYLAKLANYLSPSDRRNSSRHQYEKLIGEVSVLAYCLMDNHVHLIVRDITGAGMTRLMRRVQGAYALYFNQKYNRRGPLFDARFAAKPILDEDHARFAIAYTHLNHLSEQLDYRFGSHIVYRGDETRNWLDVEDGLRFFGGYNNYVDFVNTAGPSILLRKIEEEGVPPDRYRFRAEPRTDEAPAFTRIGSLIDLRSTRP